MDLLTILKTEETLNKFDHFLDLIEKSETPLLINSTYKFTDSICENETMEDRTDVFTNFSQFKTFEELLYPPFNQKFNKTLSAKNSATLEPESGEKGDSTIKSENSGESPSQKLQKLQNQNEKSRELVSLPVPNQILNLSDTEPQFSELDLQNELKKFSYFPEPLDLVYFFDLMLSKNARFFYKEPIPNMFYDNIFVHNSGECERNRSSHGTTPAPLGPDRVSLLLQQCRLFLGFQKNAVDEFLQFFVLLFLQNQSSPIERETGAFEGTFQR